MRIRGRRSAADNSASRSPSSSSSSSYSSSITAAHSLASSQDSSNSSSPCSVSTRYDRCRGLDLLVKAIHEVNSGSVIGVPYIQRRVTIRRRRRQGLEFLDPVVFDDRLFDRKRAKKVYNMDCDNNKKKGNKNSLRLRSKAQNSGVRPWGRSSAAAADDDVGS